MAEAVAAPQTGRRVIVGLSGGVDSSVSALLLQQQGWDVHGLFMKNWDDDDQPGHCPAEQDLADVRAVCDELTVPFHKMNFAREYWDRVFSHFLAEYRAGRTPNPDILCNKEIKFKVFLDKALDLGADFMATGHYARIDERDGRYRLLTAADSNKDQTYFLYTLGQHQLRHSLFPLGGLHKPEVRHLAAENDLVVHDKKDSTGVCFIGERDFNEFLSRYLPAQSGEIQTPEGQVIGEHHGLMYHTLGQRRGLGIGGTASGSGEPWFVVGKRLEDNVLVVAQGGHHPLLYSSRLRAIDLSWVSGETPQGTLRCLARTRHRQPLQPCTVHVIGDDVEVEFEQAQRAMTPGQSVVFYQGDECLGGGVIEHVDGIIYG